MLTTDMALDARSCCEYMSIAESWAALDTHKVEMQM